MQCLAAKLELAVYLRDADHRGAPLRRRAKSRILGAMSDAHRTGPSDSKPIRSRTLLAIALPLLAVQQAMLWGLYYGYGAKQLVGDETRYWSVAHDVVNGAPWHPSDPWPPAQQVFIAAILHIADALVAVQIVQTLLFFGCG